MIRYLFDTDHVSLQERGHPPLRARLAAAPPGSVAVCPVTVEEMVRGRLAILARRLDGDERVRGYAKLIATISFFSSVPIVAFDARCEARYQELVALRLRVGSQDLRIAAVALAQDLVVVNRNRRDFEKVPGLLIEDWSES